MKSPFILLPPTLWRPPLLRMFKGSKLPQGKSPYHSQSGTKAQTTASKIFSCFPELIVHSFPSTTLSSSHPGPQVLTYGFTHAPFSGPLHVLFLLAWNTLTPGIYQKILWPLWVFTYTWHILGALWFHWLKSHQLNWWSQFFAAFPDRGFHVPTCC